MAQTIVGLDIGNGVIRAAEISDPARGRPTLRRYHEVTLSTSAVQRGEVVEHGVVVAALKQLWSAGGFTSKKVILGMGNQRVMVRDLAVPKMPLHQIRESLSFQVQDMLPVPIGEALLDFYPISEGPGENGRVINGLLIAAIKEPVLRNVEAVLAAGLTPVDVDLIPFALSRVLLSGRDATGTSALVHVGAVTSSIVVADQGVPQFVRIVQAGGEDVTSALTRKLSIPAEQADRVKRGVGMGAGMGTEWRPAIDSITPVVGELLDSVRNTLSFYLNTHPNAVFERILLSGGGSQLPGLQQALAEATRLPVGVPDVLGRFTIHKSLDAESLRAQQTHLAVAAGLAMGRAA